ncbi:hypothetical protein LTR86_010488 [Recurvomyces mirabilis]|nr:hypothetical protein LTR86_010488 [Recurvomyces mirabilis]
MIDARAADGLPPNPHGQNLATVGIIMCIIAGVLVTCRLLTRIFMAHAVGWDDYTLALSMLLAVGMTTCFQMEVFYGMGLHTADVENANYKHTSLLWLWINQILYKIANGAIKISIALLYLRIFPSKKFKYTVWAFIGFVIAYCLAALLPSIFQCSTMTLIADAILVGLPISNLVKLQLPKAQRIALVFVFGLGIFVMATTIVRLVSLSPLASQGDLLWYQATSNSWAFLEIDVSIICASIPVLRAPIGMLFPRLLGRLSTRNGAESGNQYHGQFRSGMAARVPEGSAISMQDRTQWQKSTGGNAYVRGVHGGIDDDAASDEERILGAEGIRKTTEVTFGYDELERSRSGTFGRR